MLAKRVSASVLVTTSHRPSQRLRSFVKDLAAVIPGAVRINRGKSSLRDLFYDALTVGARRVVIVSSWKGNPGSISVYEPVEGAEPGLRRILLIRLSGAVLRREIKGSVKRIGPASRAAVDASRLPGAVQYFVDSLSRGFLYNVVFGEKEYMGYEVVAVPVLRGEVLVLDFLCPNHSAVCGPRLKIVRVEDYESGFRFHRARAWLETTS